MAEAKEPQIRFMKRKLDGLGFRSVYKYCCVDLARFERDQRGTIVQRNNRHVVAREMIELEQGFGR